MKQEKRGANKRRAMNESGGGYRGRKQFEIGVDEAGRGPVMGSMFVAGVLNFEGLADINVKDSKKLNSARRAHLAEIIEQRTLIRVEEISASQIDEERERGRSMNDITLDLASKVVCFFIRKFPVRAFVDAADVKPERFARKLKERCSLLCGSAPEIISEWKADEKYPVVSAASIIAKVRRDRCMREISEHLGCDVGSGYPSDPKTIAFLRSVMREKEIPYSVRPFVRKSWKTFHKIKKA